MSVTEALLRQPAAEAIAWALLQFVWQGALIGMLTAAALAALKRSAADVRYVVAAIALSLMLTMPVVTAVQYWRSSAAVPSSAPGTPAANMVVPPPDARSGSPAGRAARDQLEEWRNTDRPVTPAAIVDAARIDRAAFEPWLPMLLTIWLAGVSLLTLRLMSGWLWIQRLKTHGDTADDSWEQMSRRLCRRLHITRAVRLLESSLVEVPTVIGWMKPVILLPGSTLAGLSPEQLEAILAHELAHIRRHDYVVNLLQTLVETLLFYHPAVWWLSHRIRVERENCCDDLAVSLCGDPYTYARALADLEERRGSRGGLALAATGGSLLQRVRRLLGAPSSHAGRGPGWLAGTAAIIVLVGIVAGALGNDVMGAQQAPAVAAPVVAPALAAPVVAATAPSSAPVVAATTQPAAAAPADVTTQAQEAATVSPVLAASARMPVDASGIRPALAPVGADVPTAGAAEPVVAAATPVEPVERVRQGAKDSTSTFVWSNDNERLEVSFRGQVEFTDDDTDVKRLSPGGHLKIKDGGWLGGRTVEIRADAAGTLERHFRVGMSERPYEPEGRQWLAKMLPRFIRQTGMGAESRVARILKSSGPSGVLTEIARIEGSWGKRVYFRELLRQSSPDAQTARQILVQAGREIDSDFELASLLIESADKLLVDEGARKAYFDAARSIESDFEMRRVFSAALKRTPLTPALLAGLLDASRAIDSDFELAELLVQLARDQPLDEAIMRPFFAAVATIESDFEQRRVLGTLAVRRDLPADVVTGIVTAAIDVESDFELATLLVQVANDHPVEGALRAPFFRALDSIESGHERARVLQSVARRPNVSEETVTAILKSVRGVGSHEASQVLLAVAAAHSLSGPARDLYIDAAEKLGDYEQGRVLAALVRNERRK